MLDKLTEREMAILLMMCEGIGSPEIARRLGVDRGAIGGTWAKIKEKTGQEFIGPLCLIVKREING